MLQNGEFFAAANGYGGFRSYFPQVFDPKIHDAVFILKGGPGSGKSSLCRKVAAALGASGAFVETVACSSDPDSLDGVIASQGEKSVAVLDGTAPHTADPQFPGAVESIVNLGVAFRSEKLRGAKDTVRHLAKAKSESYFKSYEYLALSGIFDAKIAAEYEDALQKSTLTEYVKSLNFPSRSAAAPAKIRLLSAVCKEGYLHRYAPTPAGKTVSPVGDSDAVSAFMKALFSQLKDAADAVYPSPLREEIPEAFCVCDTLFYPQGGGEPLDVTPFFAPLTERARGRVDTLSIYRKSLFNEAVGYLADASRHHFALEAIYTPATDFAVVGQITDSLIKKAKNILFSDKNAETSPLNP